MNRSVIHVASFGSPYSGNFLASLLALREPLQKRDLDLVLAFPEFANDCPWLGDVKQRVQVEVLSPAGRLRYATPIAALAKRAGGRIVHTHFCEYDMGASLARSLVDSELGVVWHTHSPLSSSMAGRSRARLKYALFGRGVQIVTVSRPILEQVLSAGCDKEKAVCIENGVDIRRVAEATMDRTTLARTVNVSPSDYLALIFGWDPFRKGIDIAIEAVRLARERGANITLLVVAGAGEETLTWIRDRMGSVPAHVRVIRPTQNVADLYQNVDLFLSLSRAEGMTYSVIEAMAAGKPVLISQIAGQDWAGNVKGAILVPPCDISQTSMALLRVTQSSTSERAEMAAVNRSEAAKHSLTKWAEGVCSVYDKMLHLPLCGGESRPQLDVRSIAAENRG